MVSAVGGPRRSPADYQQEDFPAYPWTQPREDGEARMADDLSEGAEAYRKRWSEGEDPLAKAVQSVGDFFSDAGGAVWDGVRGLFRRGEGGAGGDDAADDDDAPGDDEAGR